MISNEAKIDPTVLIGENTFVEEYTIISSDVKIGEECKIHRHIFIDKGVKIGNRVKIQDNWRECDDCMWSYHRQMGDDRCRSGNYERCSRICFGCGKPGADCRES